MVKAVPKRQPNRLFWIVFGLIAFGAVVYVYTGDEDATPTIQRKKTKLAAADKSGFLPEDYTAKFAPAKVAVSNVFRPLVVKTKDALAGNAVPTRDGSLPEAFTGEPGWAYTGYIEINGRPNALLENDKTGEGVYVTPGQAFKKSRILTFTPNEMVVQGPTRATRSIKIGGEEPDTTVTVAPAAPVISGPIGATANVQPLPAADDSGQAALQRPRRRNRNRNNAPN
ncbi:hypothetical protein BH11ARM2_BH11ARM2_24300 [soil metagenome]